MPQKPRALPTELGAHFSTTSAIQHGLTRGRLRAKDLASPFHGSRRRKDDIEREARELEKEEPLARTRAAQQRVRSQSQSYLPVMTPGGFVCGLSAAVLHGYPVSEPSDLAIGVIAPRRAPRGNGVTGRKVEPHLVEVEILDGIPVTTPATTWAMLGRDLNERRLTILADAIIRVPRDRFAVLHPELAGATIDQLQSALDAGRRVGLPRLRAALERARVGSASPLETEYRLDAEDAGLPEPELDFEVRSTNGRLLGISEIAYPEFRLVVEVEGDHHRTSKTQWNRDIEKYRDYANAGWEVLRLTSAHIRTQHSAAATVRTALWRRGWRPGPRRSLPDALA